MVFPATKIIQSTAIDTIVNRWRIIGYSFDRFEIGVDEVGSALEADERLWISERRPWTRY
jgi:hypothetical protein